MTRTGYCTAPPPGISPNVALIRPKNGRLSGGEAHAAREDELAARAADATLDLRDRHEATGAEMAEQERDSGLRR